MTTNNKTTSEKLRNPNISLWFGIGFLAYSLLFFVKSFEIPYHTKFGPGPAMYPRWLSGISIIIAIFYVWQSCTKHIFRAKECLPGKKELLNVASIFASCLVFLFLLNIVGFNIAGSLLMFVVFVRQYKLWQAIALSISITFICFFVFKVLFSVPLPVNMFGF